MGLAGPPIRSPFKVDSGEPSLPWIKWFQAIVNAVNTPAFPSAAQVPANANSSGTQGQIAFDAAGNLYVCVAPNKWSKYMGNVAF